MNWVLAMFAFAGIMAVMSTVVSVVVEAIHKLFRLRSSGLKDMLVVLHDQVMSEIDDGSGAKVGGDNEDVSRGSASAHQFAKDMTRSPAYGTNYRSRWLAIIPLFGQLSRHFQSLSKLQFVEQLTTTEVGRNMATNLSRDQIRAALNRIVYEFDRFGAMQSAYFSSRAKIFTTAVALIIVVAGNFNAISIYTYLAKDDAASSHLANIIANDPDALVRLVDARIAYSEGLGEDPNAQSLVANYADDIKELSTLGFPVGRKYFPYCSFLVGADGKIYEGETRDNLLADDFNARYGPCEIDGWMPPINLAPNYTSYALPRMFTSEGALWFIGMIATAGLIGLGAPFWYNLFKSLAALLVKAQPQATRAQAEQRWRDPRPAQGEIRRPFDGQRPELANPGGEPDLDVLTDAFLIVAGKAEDTKGPAIRPDWQEHVSVPEEALPPPATHKSAAIMTSAMPPQTQAGQAYRPIRKLRS